MKSLLGCRVARTSATVVALALTFGTAFADEVLDEVSSFDIPTQPLDQALLEFSKQADVQIIMAADTTRDLTASGIRGKQSNRDALEQLLADQDLNYTEHSNRTIAVHHAAINVDEVSSNPGKFRSTPNSIMMSQASELNPVQSNDKTQSEDDPAASRQQDRQIEEVIVTGTNIRGERSVGSPVLTFDREEISRSGFVTPEQFFDALPQNLGNAASERSIFANADRSDANNVNDGTAVNLRGLGGGSTLVLLDGRRLAPAGGGAFYDISMIPLSAVERIEIIPDGASAIYGADAIGGVVNFILRDELSGAETSLRYGNATEGGLEEYTATQALGTSWSSGKVFANYEYYDRSNVGVEDRSYSANALRPNDIVPSQSRHSFLAMLTQQAGARFEIIGDVLYSSRQSDRRFTDLVILPRVRRSEAEQIQASLTGVAELTETWHAELQALHGINSNDSENIQLVSGSDTSFESEFRLSAVDARIGGNLFQTPAGAIKLALGGGYREEDLQTRSQALQRDVVAAFAEILIPVVGDANAMAGLRRLEISLAGRIEDYNDFGSASNPKIGVNWQPLKGLDLRSSWGTSFRAPLLDDFDTSANNAILFSAADPFAADGTTLTLFLNGGNPDLIAEEATTWTVGMDLQIDSLPGLELSTTYFDIDFENRIGTVPSVAVTSITESAVRFAPAVRLNPTVTEIEEILAISDFIDFYGEPFELSDIEGIFDARVNNLAVEQIQGLDFQARYRREVAGGRVTAGVNVSYLLDFKRATSASSELVQLVSTAFNPVDLTLRGDIGWTSGWLTAALFVNFTDGYTNVIPDPDESVDSWTTIGVGLGLDLQEALDHPFAEDLNLNISARNVFNEDPPFVTGPPLRTAVNYDTVNADPIGRLLSVQLQKRW